MGHTYFTFAWPPGCFRRLLQPHSTTAGSKVWLRGLTVSSSSSLSSVIKPMGGHRGRRKECQGGQTSGLPRGRGYSQGHGAHGNLVNTKPSYPLHPPRFQSPTQARVATFAASASKVTTRRVRYAARPGQSMRSGGSRRVSGSLRPNAIRPYHDAGSSWERGSATRTG